METAKQKVPPDGGYGWVVTLAYALNNVVVLPLISGFGLVFQEAFEETELSASQGTLVITLNHGVAMLLSFFGGPLLKRFGYRKVALVGSLLIFTGLILTSLANNFWTFIFSYSIITAMGVSAVMAAFTLAINSFFKEKRGRAIGVGMSLTGLGVINMPLLMSLLITLYGWRGAVFVLAALCLHSFVGGTLLRPAKWYLKDIVPSEEELVPLKSSLERLQESCMTTSSKQNGNTLPVLPESTNEELNHTKSMSMRSLDSSVSLQGRHAISHPDLRKKEVDLQNFSRIKWWESQEFNLESSINIFESELNLNQREAKEGDNKVNKEEEKGLLQKIVDFFDLTLLTDPVFVNILLGLSLAACVDTNFSLLLPMILKDMMQFETSEIAQIMAVIGFSDTIFRFVSPFIGEWCQKPPRMMYIFSLLLIIFIRSVMLLATTFNSMLIVAIAIGVSKGIRTVYMNIVIPAYVPIERLAFASGIQMFFNGIIIISIGSFVLGPLRETSGSYRMPIVVLNIITMMTIVMWSAEFLYFRIRKCPTNPCA